MERRQRVNSNKLTNITGDARQLFCLFMTRAYLSKVLLWSTIINMLFATIFAGILVFSETDLQHAVYWRRDKSSDDQCIMLKQFEDVWR